MVAEGSLPSARALPILLLQSPSAVNAGFFPLPLTLSKSARLCRQPPGGEGRALPVEWQPVIPNRRNHGACGCRVENRSRQAACGTAASSAHRGGRDLAYVYQQEVS